MARKKSSPSRMIELQDMDAVYSELAEFISLRDFLMEAYQEPRASGQNENVSATTPQLRSKGSRIFSSRGIPLKLKSSIASLRSRKRTDEQVPEVPATERNFSFKKLKEKWIKTNKPEQSDQSQNEVLGSRPSFGSAETHWPGDPRPIEHGEVIRTVSRQRTQGSITHPQHVLNDLMMTAQAARYTTGENVTPSINHPSGYQRRVITPSELSCARSHQGIVESFHDHEDGTSLNYSPELRPATPYNGVWENDSRVGITLPEFTPRTQPQSTNREPMGQITIEDQMQAMDRSLAMMALHAGTTARIERKLDQILERVEGLENSVAAVQAEQGSARAHGEELRKNVHQNSRTLREVQYITDDLRDTLARIAHDLRLDKLSTSSYGEADHSATNEAEIEDINNNGGHLPSRGAPMQTYGHPNRENATLTHHQGRVMNMARAFEDPLRRMPPANRRLAAAFEAQARSHGTNQGLDIIVPANNHSAQAVRSSSSTLAGLPQGVPLTVPQFHAGSPGGVTYELPAFLSSPGTSQDGPSYR